MSTTASDDSFDCKFAKCGLADDMLDIPTMIEYDSVQQITLYIYPGIVDLLGDENGDTGTIRSGVSDGTMATSKTRIMSEVPTSIESDFYIGERQS